MIDTQNQDFSYAYIIALCGAIEKVVTQEDVENPKIFSYKNSDLKYALERSLYFSYANSDPLFEIFKQWKTSKLPKKIQVKDDVQKKLIAQMCHIDENKIYIEKLSNGKIIIKDLVRFCVITFGLNRLATFTREKINASYQNKTYEVLFYVINERFIKYMKPIFDKIPVSCAYITHNRKTADYLEKEKIPFVEISRFGYALTRWSQKDSWLKRFMITEQYDLLTSSIKRIHPKSVVFVEGNVPSYEIVNKMCKKLGIKSVCIQQGWSPIVHNGFRHMSYSKMLVWGEGFANDLKAYNPHQNFISTGSFTIETKPAKKVEKISTVALFFHGTGRMVPPKTLDDFLDFTKQLVKQEKNIQIIIREHPVYTLDKKTKSELLESGHVTFMSGPKYSIESVMEKSDLNISVYSGTCLESIASGILPLMINITSCPHFFPDIGKLGAGIEVKSVDEALKTLKQCIENPNMIQKFFEPMEKFKNEYFAYNKEEAMKNIIKEITT